MFLHKIAGRRRIVQRILASFALVGILCLLAVLGLSTWVKSAASGYILSEEDAAKLRDVDCILVLGCSVHGDQPSPMLSDRLEVGVALYRLGAAPKLLMSGDHGTPDYDEVNVMKEYALDAGVPSEDVFMDHAGFSTYESAYRARDVFCASKVLIVTQSYHLYRAVYDARSLGLDAYGVAADQQVYAGQVYRDAREMLAQSKDVFCVLLNTKPTYLGDALPVSGDGNCTNDK